LDLQGKIFSSRFHYIVGDTKRAMTNFEQANKIDKQLSRVQPERQFQWTKSDIGQTKVNVDAALEKKARLMGFGILLRDHKGRFPAAKCIKRVGFIGLFSSRGPGSVL
jgi:hypothetical protein